MTNTDDIKLIEQPAERLVNLGHNGPPPADLVEMDTERPRLLLGGLETRFNLVLDSNPELMINNADDLANMKSLNNDARRVRIAFERQGELTRRPVLDHNVGIKAAFDAYIAKAQSVETKTKDAENAYHQRENARRAEEKQNALKAVDAALAPAKKLIDDALISAKGAIDSAVATINIEGTDDAIQGAIDGVIGAQQTAMDSVLNPAKAGIDTAGQAAAQTLDEPKAALDVERATADAKQRIDDYHTAIKGRIDTLGVAGKGIIDKAKQDAEMAKLQAENDALKAKPAPKAAPKAEPTPPPEPAARETTPEVAPVKLDEPVRSETPQDAPLEPGTRYQYFAQPIGDYDKVDLNDLRPIVTNSVIDQLIEKLIREQGAEAVCGGVEFGRRIVGKTRNLNRRN